MTTRIAAVIPVYNHGGTLRDVVVRTLSRLPDVIVVDDGSTDGGPQTLADLPITLVRFARNRGKGAALLAGAEAARQLGASHMISLDADGQHYPEDIPAFLEAVAGAPHAFIVGQRDFSGPGIPGASRFGRAFSGFWMFIQTGCRVGDMQSGYRVYPLAALACLPLSESGYSFEVEVLVRAAWAGFAVVEIPIRVLYRERKQRISHFRPLGDNLRISWLNTRLTIRALVPVPFRHHALEAEGNISLLSPMQSLQRLLKASTPRKLAWSAAVSMVIGALPLFGLQSILLLYCINRLRLNRLCALAMIPLTWPPLVPGLCVLVGYRIAHGTWLTEFSVRTLGHEAPQRLLEWIPGGLALAPVLGAGAGILVYGLARIASSFREEETA